MPDGPSGTVVSPVVRLSMVVLSGMTTGLDTVPSAATAKCTRSEVCGNHSDLPSADHSGPSAATVPSPMTLSVPTPVPICWMIWPVLTLIMVSQPVNSFQVSAARYWPFGLMDEDSRRPASSVRTRVPIGLIHCWVGSRMPLA